VELRELSPVGISPCSVRVGRSRLRRAAFAGALAFLGYVGIALGAEPPPNPYPAASHTPCTRNGWERFLTNPDPTAPPDEPQGGRTELGTPITHRIEPCYPAEDRNLFWEVDQVASGPNGALEPLKYNTDGQPGITDEQRNAIRGQNTWMLWGEGNEAFWGWLQERGYGLADFLILLDSRRRGSRFKEDGLVNQPGMESQTDPAKRILGLYLDQAAGDKITLHSPPSDIDRATGKPPVRVGEPKVTKGSSCAQCHGEKNPPLFEPGDRDIYEKTLKVLPDDGIDPFVYGYPSGIVGLRLMPNPDFFGNTSAAAEARKYWDKQVVHSKVQDAFYTDVSIAADPKLVRPFRINMACAFCHIGPHPLNPPADPESPEWKNLSSTIGNQYWTPPRAFANLLEKDNFLYHFIASQQPGTIDTSLVSTDHINNPNTINAVFDLPARVARAMKNPPEHQSPANLLERSIEDGNSDTNPRHTPRVLLDGADSIGAFGALARVYLNIGTYPEQWRRCHNPIIGFIPQQPFSLSTCEANSVFWRTAEKYRIPYLAAFFLLQNASQAPASSPNVATATTPETPAAPAQAEINSAPVRNGTASPMRLVHAPGGKEILATESQLAAAGRAVFLKNCAMCHSSKQPDGYELKFSRDWRTVAAPKPKEPARYTLPMDFSEWELFKKSDAYADYGKRITDLAGVQQGDSDPFLRDNFLSTDIRVPVTLTGTNSGRAAGTNGMRGQVWDNFSSDDYKKLPAVGAVRFYNPYSGVAKDTLGFNDSYYPPGDGPGYYRPASLISLWATGPYLHNNTLGIYNEDPSIKGRLEVFEDGISKLLWNAKRAPSANGHPGDLRFAHKEFAGGDPGFIYRIPEPTNVRIAGGFIRELLQGILGAWLTNLLTLYFWILLAIVFALLVWFGKVRQAGFVFAVIGFILAAVLIIARFDKALPILWLLPVLALGWAFALWFGKNLLTAARISFGVLAILSLVIGFLATTFVNGGFGPLKVGPIPAGTPVNLVMNINPEAPLGNLVNAGASLIRGSLIVQTKGLKGEEALNVFQAEAGMPLLKASKCPDFVLDRGHWFGEGLSDDEKTKLKAFLKTL